MELLDTPGILWPKFEDQRVGLYLALIGAIKDEILNIDELSLELIKILLSDYPTVLKERYGVEEDAEPPVILGQIAEKHPEAKIVCNAKTVGIIKQFFDLDIDSRSVVVKEGDTLCTGKHNLTFVMAPMVHWPEVMVTYDSTEKVLFSADGFGKFGANDVEEDWDDEARRLLYRNRRKIWYTGTKPLKSGSDTGYPDDLSAARTDFKGESWTLYREI